MEGLVMDCNPVCSGMGQFHSVIRILRRMPLLRGTGLPGGRWDLRDHNRINIRSIKD